MATSEAKEIKKQETLVRFSIISYKTRLRVFLKVSLEFLKQQNFKKTVFDIVATVEIFLTLNQKVQI